MSLVFYGLPLSPFVMRVAMAARLKGLDLPMTPPPGGFGSEEYRKVNPLGKIPSLEIDGRVLPESEVICEYLDDLHPTPALRPADPEARARNRLLSRVADIYVMNPMLPIFRNLDPATRDAAAIATAVADSLAGLDKLEAFIQPGPCAQGDTLTLADCALVPILLFVEKVPPMFGGPADSFAGRPKVAAYWQAVQANPVAAGILAEMKAALAAVGF